MRHTRNFWIEGSIDGRKTKLKGGPRSAKGGFSMLVKQRKNGLVSVAATLVGKLSKCGKSLALEITTPGGEKKTVWTQR